MCIRLGGERKAVSTLLLQVSASSLSFLYHRKSGVLKRLPARLVLMLGAAVCLNRKSYISNQYYYTLLCLVV